MQLVYEEICMIGFLNNREQFVSYNDVLLETKQISHGVPQGSILGPPTIHTIFK